MKKYIIITCYLLLIFLMTGCLSIEQRKEKVAIEKEVKEIMEEYLQENYNVNKVNNVTARYTLTGDIADSQFKEIVTANFKKNGEEYQILYDYKKKKCYDSLSYIKKVNPILTNHINSILENNLTYSIDNPNYVALDNEYYDYVDYSNYGFFNNSDNVSTYEEIINYYDFIMDVIVIYNVEGNIIDNNILVFEKLPDKLNNYITVKVYNDGIIKEEFHDSIEGDSSYYMNEIQKIGNFIAYWKVKEINAQDLGKLEQGDFELSLVNNTFYLDNLYFEDAIELYGRKYTLKSNEILKVKDISNNEDLHYIYIELNRELCKTKSAIVYNDSYYGLSSVNYMVSFSPGLHETKNFAIYCIK